MHLFLRSLLATSSKALVHLDRIPASPSHADPTCSPLTSRSCGAWMGEVCFEMLGILDLVASRLLATSSDALVTSIL